jgi:1-hydroxycarotenoid 3,4-desaturase
MYPGAVLPDEQVVVVGAGIGGLAAAIELAREGLGVLVCDSAQGPGGKLREVGVGGRRLDAGPTVLTLRAIFDDLLAAGGQSLDDELQRATTLARHYWPDGSTLDLHADAAQTRDAIAAFAGLAEARRLDEFMARARRCARLMEAALMREADPSALGLTLAALRGRPSDLLQLSPFVSLWRTLERSFHDRRLRQLFGRYATYCGSSPWRAPATLGVIAQVEADGVWLLRGGLHGLARALERAALALGVRFQYSCRARSLDLERGRLCGLTLESGEHRRARWIIFNGDAAALGAGHLGEAMRRAVPPAELARRSLSAMTWNLVAATRGVPLSHHTVFFSDDYAREFEELFTAGSIPAEPTVYVCAQDRDATGDLAEPGNEGLLCIVNAPPVGDSRRFPANEVEACETRMRRQLQRCGLTLDYFPEHRVASTPADFERLYPGTGGALYGPATHGWRAAFRRPRSRTRLAGLYLAGGSTHPGAGLPMAALSGMHAAASLMEDLGSRSRSSTTATRGGTWTRWATTARKG